MNENQKQLLELDLYKLFDLDEICSVEQIKKAYRKKALELHPDKNLDNKEEAEKNFIQLGKAFEILTDAAAKAAYDAVRRNRRERAARLEKLDDKRKKLKMDLEARENQATKSATVTTATTTVTTNKTDEERFQREIERLRKEGSKLLEEEMNIINEEIKKKVQISKTKVNNGENDELNKPARIKLTWKINESTSNNDFKNEDLLRHLFGKYGTIEILIVNSKKTGAVIEYKNVDDALIVLSDEHNLNKKYGINLKWLGPSLDLIKDKVEKEKNSFENPIVIVDDDDDKKFDKNNEHELNNEQHLSFEEMEAAILKKLQKANN